VVLKLEIPVKTEKLLPLKNGKGGVKRVEIGNLDVAVIVVIARRILEGHSPAEMVALLWCARRHSHNAAQGVVI
jgi:hypothetical protein